MTIGLDDKRKAVDKHNAKKKRDLLLQAQGFLERYELPNDPLLMHSEGFYNYFLRLYSETYKNFPLHMTVLERLAMANVDTTVLKELDLKYKKIGTPFDPITMEPPISVNYDIVLTGSELELYKAQTHALESLQKLKAVCKFNYPHLPILERELNKRLSITYFLR